MSEQTTTKTPDGRFELFCRIKSDWGDLDGEDKKWFLTDLRTGQVIRTWRREDRNDVQDVAFDTDFRSLRIVGPDGKVETFPLPE